MKIKHVFFGFLGLDAFLFLLGSASIYPANIILFFSLIGTVVTLFIWWTGNIATLIVHAGKWIDKKIPNKKT